MQANTIHSQPLRICKNFQKMKRSNFKLIFIVTYFSLVFLFCEFVVYYAVESQCSWPSLNLPKNSNQHESPLKVMILADTHLLGPHQGHWLDKLRREWQMHRSFQTAITLFSPELIFILGDIFDEGYFVNHDEFQNYLNRFHKLFYVPKSTKIIIIVGNHDVGFHYRMHPFFSERFDNAFNNTAVMLHTFRDVHFVTINSMAMENDECFFCEMALEQLETVSKYMKCYRHPANCNIEINKSIRYSRPIIMQHFPTYRKSDEKCLEGDSPDIAEKFRENWEVLSKNSTKLLGNLLNPRLAFSGHSHNFCHTKTILNIDEYTLPSFSWRYKNQPSFILGLFTKQNHALSICYLPKETMVISIYAGSALLFAIMYVAIFRSERIYKKCS